MQWVTDKKSKLKVSASTKILYDNFHQNLVGSKTVALEHAFDVFLTEMARDSGCERHVQTKRTHIQDFFSFVNTKFSNISQLNEVSTEMARAYKLFLEKHGNFTRYQSSKKSIHLSNRTINIYITNLKQLFTVLADKSSTDKNPFDVTRIKLSNNSEEREIFEDDEIERIFANVDQYLKPLFIVGISTGLREGDICELKKEHIDLNGEWIEKRNNKTGKKTRIPILPELKDYLESIDWNDGSEYLFPKLANDYQNRRTLIGWRVSRFLKGLGIKTLKEVSGRSRKINSKGIHSLRHQFITRALNYGVELNVIQDTVGHSSEILTRAYASHVKDQQKKEAFKKFQHSDSSNQVMIKLLQSMDENNWSNKRDEALNLLQTKKVPVNKYQTFVPYQA